MPRPRISVVDNYSLPQELKLQFETALKNNDHTASQVIRAGIKFYLLTGQFPQRSTADNIPAITKNEYEHLQVLRELAFRLGKPYDDVLSHYTKTFREASKQDGSKGI